ncbi:Uu.00g092410.m01.CDS01 [Anthostomella pinea]|uniref:Uu.00g092410.m01.CDS01 n=1 Tax=Anthostomella pinea TaxID=933095 RepID=A0AAI8YKG3_9PEZI|nr:Uu.00g092410.m01.CDS01 [Anthostomella pinea]
MSSASSGKTPRVLACVLCQNRKIKCDRNSPCSNCIKANVACTPSVPAPARKRRRPNQDLQQRLARCEELLSDYATGKPEDTTKESPTRDESWKPLGKLIVDDGGVKKFMDSYLWANIHGIKQSRRDELSAMREILEDEETIDDSNTPAEPQSPELNTALVLSDSSNADLEDLHPQPAHVFHLWQTFLERVNPITKIIHVPTLQPMLFEAAISRASVLKNTEALLFAIYLMAAVAMTQDECRERLGYTRAEALDRFSKGCRTALVRIGILKDYDLTILQAMVLYLFSLIGRYDRHAAWILNGVTVRIAQKMGLHRDGEFLGLSPFETEMRRRIWWQIVLLDAIYALMSGLGQSLLPRSWDTKEPRNINDSDLYPNMTAVQAKDGPTDMIYVLISYEMAKLMVETPILESVILQNEFGAPDTPAPEEVDKARKRIVELDDTIGDLLDKYGDLSMGPVHELAMATRPMLMDKLRDLTCPPREQPEWGTEIMTPKDNLFKISLSTGEHNLRMYRTTQLRGTFLWFMMTHFQLDILIYMVGQLSSRMTGQLVERAWAVTEQLYHFHQELYDLSVKPHAALAIFAIRGWKQREKWLLETGAPAPTTPGYILKLQTLLPSAETKHIPEDVKTPDLSNLNMAGDAVAPQTQEVPAWDSMLGLVDTGAIDWDMFAGSGNGPLPTGNGGYGNYGTSYTNSWM